MDCYGLTTKAKACPAGWTNLALSLRTLPTPWRMGPIVHTWPARDCLGLGSWQRGRRLWTHRPRLLGKCPWHALDSLLHGTLVTALLGKTKQTVNLIMRQIQQKCLCFLIFWSSNSAPFSVPCTVNRSANILPPKTLGKAGVTQGTAGHFPSQAASSFYSQDVCVL